MRAAVIGLLVLVVVGYLSVKIGTVYSSRSDLETRVERQLDFVDENSLTTVKQDLVRDAAKLGVELTPEDIHIVYQDTQQMTLPQQLVGERLAQFTNKQVGINVHYVARILGVPLSQEIACSKIKQVQVRAKPDAASKQFQDSGE